MSCSPSDQPLMTPSSGNRAGSPVGTELSNVFPAGVQPVYSTVTRSWGPGWLVPLPLTRTLKARPLAIFLASAGGAATSGGAPGAAGGGAGGSGSIGWAAARRPAATWARRRAPRTSGQPAPRKAAPRKAAPRKAAPRKAAPRKAAPRKDRHLMCAAYHDRPPGGERRRRRSDAARFPTRYVTLFAGMA